MNTAVLIGSSLTMALAVHAAAVDKRRTLMLFLVLTMLLGLVFLGIKGFEYAHKFEEHHVPGLGFHFEGPAPERANLFFSLYFAMTGLHALHMIIGLGIMSVMLWMAARRKFSARWYTPDRDQRPLLALRGHRLDLPVPAAVPGGQAPVVGTDDDWSD